MRKLPLNEIIKSKFTRQENSSLIQVVVIRVVTKDVTKDVTKVVIQGITTESGMVEIVEMREEDGHVVANESLRSQCRPKEAMIKISKQTAETTITEKNKTLQNI